MTSDLILDRYPALVPITTTIRRGYTEAIAYFILLFGMYALDAATALGFPATWIAHISRWDALGHWITLAILAFWLSCLHSRRQTWTWATGALIFLAAYVAVTSGTMPAPDEIYETLTAVTAILLAITLARRRGLTITELGIGRDWGRGDYAARRQASKTFLCVVAGSVLTSTIGGLISVVGLPHGSSPLRDDPVDEIFTIVFSGVCEELLAAVVVIVLTAARRPAWEMYALSAALRISYHLYYQAASISLLASGLTNVWLYRRTRRLTPIICGHISIDLIAWAHQSGIIWAILAGAVFGLTNILTDKYWAKNNDPKNTTTNDQTVTPK